MWFKFIVFISADSEECVERQCVCWVDLPSETTRGVVLWRFLSHPSFVPGQPPPHPTPDQGSPQGFLGGGTYRDSWSYFGNAQTRMKNPPKKFRSKIAKNCESEISVIQEKEMLPEAKSTSFSFESKPGPHEENPKESKNHGNGLWSGKDESLRSVSRPRGIM